MVFDKDDYQLAPVEGRRVFRRKKRFQGATWTPPSMSAAAEDGVWCSSCRKRHGYKTLGLLYGERRTDGRFKLLWYCKETGTVVKED